MVGWGDRFRGCNDGHSEGIKETSGHRHKEMRGGGGKRGGTVLQQLCTQCMYLTVSVALLSC